MKVQESGIELSELHTQDETEDVQNAAKSFIMAALSSNEDEDTACIKDLVSLFQNPILALAQKEDTRIAQVLARSILSTTLSRVVGVAIDEKLVQKCSHELSEVVGVDDLIKLGPVRTPRA